MKDFRGMVVAHTKATVGEMTLSLKKGYQYVSVNLGVWDKKDNLEVDDCKRELMNLGWILIDDIEEILGEDKTEKMLQKIQKKYTVEKEVEN